MIKHNIWHLELLKHEITDETNKQSKVSVCFSTIVIKIS